MIFRRARIAAAVTSAVAINAKAIWSACWVICSLSSWIIFISEEKMMRDSLLVLVNRDLCDAHMEDHAVISGKVQQIVAALDPMQTPSLIRELDALLHRWLSNHISLHDMWLARWIEREDSILRTAATFAR
jgi:hemerythrin